MKRSDVLAALRSDEEQRRREAKKRETEVLRLMEEQDQDLEAKGKLWREVGFADLREAEDRKWEGDVIAKYVPDHSSNPERIVMLREIFGISSSAIRSVFGEETYKLFLNWLDRTTVAEMAEEGDRPFFDLLQIIKAVVAECRRALGTDPSVFPFREIGGKALKAIRWRKYYRQRIKTNSGPANPEAVVLTDAERQMAVGDLLEHLRKRGFTTSRSTAFKAKARGWFLPTEKQYGGRRAPGEKVRLSEADHELSRRAVAAKFGISYETACKAMRRGYFIRNSQNALRVPRQSEVE
jgi:hypothetical protein